jgi:hypothetical protein
MRLAHTDQIYIEPPVSRVAAAVKPYQQGSLDRLCGLYAVINSIRQSLR